MASTPAQEMRSASAGPHPTTLNDRERKLWQDHEWVLHDADVQRTYAGSVVAVSNQAIIASGKTHRAALEAALARPDCPPRDQIVTVAVEGQPLPVPDTSKVGERP